MVVYGDGNTVSLTKFSFNFQPEASFVHFAHLVFKQPMNTKLTASQLIQIMIVPLGAPSSGLDGLGPPGFFRRRGLALNGMAMNPIQLDEPKV